jgi:hypothetical protein
LYSLLFPVLSSRSGVVSWHWTGSCLCSQTFTYLAWYTGSSPLLHLLRRRLAKRLACMPMLWVILIF